MTTVTKPWGSYDVIFERKDFKVKYIIVNEGQRLSLQRHSKRSESWVVVEGHPVVVKGSSKILLNPEDDIYIPKGEIHRLEAPHDTVKIIEVQHGDCDEDDIERLQDDYSR